MTPSGLIIADIGPYLGRSTPRPSMMVGNKKNGMYDYWQEMNDLMWEKSKPVRSTSPKPLASKTKTLVLSSGRETNIYDIQTESWRPASIARWTRAGGASRGAIGFGLGNRRPWKKRKPAVK